MIVIAHVEPSKIPFVLKVICKLLTESIYSTPVKTLLRNYCPLATFHIRNIFHISISGSQAYLYSVRGMPVCMPAPKNKKESSETAVVTIREHFISISLGSDQSKKNQKRRKKETSRAEREREEHIQLTAGRHCRRLPGLER